MLSSSRMSQSLKTALYLSLGIILLLNSLVLSPVPSSAAVAPLPGPSNPLLYDDFNGGGVFKQSWMNWYNQAGGTGTFTKATVDSRTVGKFAQNPATNASWAKFQPWNESVNLSGYRYLNFTMKNPGYANSLIRIVIGDGTRNYNLTNNFVSVPTDWTVSQFDLDALAPAINKSKINIEIWLRQSGGLYGETLIDEISATTGSGGTAPTVTNTSLTTNSGSISNQNTLFTFHATYTDLDNEKPYVMQLVIDDKAYEMRQIDNADTNYTNGKDYIYRTKLPAGSHSYYFRTTDLTSNEVRTTTQATPVVITSEQVIDVVVSQAGYNTNDLKNAKVISSIPLTDTSYEILNGSTVVTTGSLAYEGFIWDKHVYAIDFSSVTVAGDHYSIKSNGIDSFSFPIQPNIWDGFKDEMTAFYRLQRASVATSDAYPPGYSSVAPSAKIFHPAGHLDDGGSLYDLTGSWYDAGDYGKYGGNQWVGAQIALAYLRYSDSPNVKYDIDNNGIPDLVDEAIFGSEYLVKFANQLGGAMYNLGNNAGFIHPHKSTDNIRGTADDRTISGIGVGGSAKSAGTLAATARAIRTAIAKGDIAPAKVAALTSFAAACEAAAVTFYDYVVANPTQEHGSYETIGGLSNAKLLADVELYLLTSDTKYKDAATTNINTLAFKDLYSTNYWDMRPMSLAEFYPVADTTTQAHIQSLLKQQVDYFLSNTDDTPYAVLNQFSNFGVNEPHVSYLGDVLRYYELFGDPAALRAVLKGMYWVFGENPWNISWVSGIGSNFVNYPHTRFDEEANSATAPGVVLPGAMVSGPNMKDTRNKKSVSPWYEDRSVYLDDLGQWRYNEFSISIQAGLLYTIMGLSATDTSLSSGGTEPVKLPILSPVIGDYVRGNVTIFADPAASLNAIEYANGATYSPMTVSGSVYSATINESLSEPYSNKIIRIRGTEASGSHTFSQTHYTVAAPLPDTSTPLFYDDFDGKGLWGATGGKSQWVNWYNQNGGTGSFARSTEGSRKIGVLSQTPTSNTSYAKFQPWHDEFDLSGYRYLNFNLKNPGSENLRIRIELSDGTRTHNLTKGWVAVPSTWKDLQLDLNGLPNSVDKKNVALSIWLMSTNGTYSELYIDDIKATNSASGSAPTLTLGSVDQATGDKTTDFTFNVTYTDVDNEAPFVVELVIDGVVRYMKAVPSSTNYSSGKVYTYTTKLPPGVHSYYFHTTDTTSAAVSTAVQVGPTVN